MTASKLGNLPHPAVLLDDCPQLHQVITELEAGTYPQPDDAVWRDDLPRELAIRLAKATGATDEQIAAIIAEPHAKGIPAEPTTWQVAVTGTSGTEHTEYRNGKDAHRVASDRSRAPGVDYATVTFNGCVTTYRDGIGTGPDAEPASEPAPESPPMTAAQKWRNVDAGPQQVRNVKKAMSALLTEGKTFDELTGVSGGEERRWTMSSPFSPVRPEVAALHEAIKAKYGHEVTRATARAIVADYEAALPEAVKSRPTEDKRRTAEEEAERQAEERAAEERTEPAPGCKRLTIKHTHEDGTLIIGTAKGDGVYEIVKTWQGGHFRYFPSIRMIGIAQSRDHLAKRGQIDQAAKALREAGHVVTVEIDDTPRDVAEVKEDRAERLDARYDRLTTKAERNLREAEARHAAADAISERFSGGQPILVGHHSERRARRDHERMEQNDRAANRHYAKAEYASQAAAVVGREDRRRERPDVIRRRIDKNETELRLTVHRINGTRPAHGWRGWYPTGPATGEYLEQLRARVTYLEHQLEADRALLAEHEANGYVHLTRDDLHKGDRVHWGATWGDGVHGATVTRVNPKTVTLDRTSYPRTLPYEQIKSVECPHDGKTTTVTAPKRDTPKREAPAVVVERPAEREAPVMVGAGTEFFPTPAPIVDRMIGAAGHTLTGMRVLEPSAGLGAIVRPVAARGAEVDCIELDWTLGGKLREAGFTVQGADFLEVEPTPVYDRVLMNPPFKNQADIRHVTHALRFLKPGGLLVAIMSAGAEFRQDKTAQAFRQLVADRGGRIERLPEDAFTVETCNTAVRTVMAVIPAAAPALPDGCRIVPATVKRAGESVPAYWAVTPDGAMTLHEHQSHAYAHLVKASA